jgi:large subunit ribosomal protein L32
MAPPKRRTSKARRNKRRSHLALSVAGLSLCPRCSQKKLPHTICGNCGYYGSEPVIPVEGA